MGNSQRFLRWHGEMIVFSSPLSREEAVKRLHASLETSLRLSPTFFFSGEVHDSTFTLRETVHFGKRNTGIRITGEIVSVPTGSEISVHIRPLVPDAISRLLLLMLVATGLGYLSYLIVLGHYPVSCLIIPLILVGVFGIVLSSSHSDSPPPYANIEAHLRQIFMVTAPTKRLPYA